jgi:hypothetical protein
MNKYLLMPAPNLPLSKVPRRITAPQKSIRYGNFRQISRFHNGGQAPLAQVVAFYNRGGDFSNPQKDPDVTRLGLPQTEQDNLVAFLQSLTDDRVRCSRAPFDHLELLVPDGQKQNASTKDRRLADKLRLWRLSVLPAILPVRALPIPAICSRSRGTSVVCR